MSQEQIKDLPKLTQEMQIAIKKAIADPNMENVKDFSQKLSMIMRSVMGLPIEPDNIYSKTIDLKDKSTYSNFPTYPMVNMQVYLRLVAAFTPEASSMLEWADKQASAMMSYKGLSREQYTEMSKVAGNANNPQSFSFAMGQPTEQPKLKQQKAKPESEEFE